MVCTLFTAADNSPWRTPFDQANHLLHALGAAALQWRNTDNAMPRRTLFRSLTRHNNAIQAQNRRQRIADAYPGRRFFRPDP